MIDELGTEELILLANWLRELMIREYHAPAPRFVVLANLAYTAGRSIGRAEALVVR